MCGLRPSRGMPRHLTVTRSITNVCFVTLLCVIGITVMLGCVAIGESGMGLAQCCCCCCSSERPREDRLLTVNLRECSEAELEMGAESEALNTEPGLR